MKGCISVACFKGASSLGDRYTAEFDGENTVTVESRPARYLPRERSIYTVDGKKLREDLSRIASKHRILQLCKLPPNPLFAPDAPSRAVSFIFDDDKIGSVNSRDLLPACSTGIYRETISCLQNACGKGTLLSGKRWGGNDG